MKIIIEWPTKIIFKAIAIGLMRFLMVSSANAFSFKHGGINLFDVQLI